MILIRELFGGGAPGPMLYGWMVKPEVNCAKSVRIARSLLQPINTQWASIIQDIIYGIKGVIGAVAVIGDKCGAIGDARLKFL